MSSTRFGRNQLISHVLFTRKTAAVYQLIMLLAAALFFAAFYRHCEATYTVDRLANFLGPGRDLSEAARPHLIGLAGDVRRLFLESVRSQSWVMLGAFTLACLGADVFLLLFSLAVDGTLIPRNEWGDKYLAREKAADRKIVMVVAVVLGAVAGFGVWRLYGWVFEAGPPDPALLVPTTWLITLISLALAAEYLVQSRWGFLSYLSSAEVGDGDFVRILAARLLTALSYVLLLVLVIFALRHVLEPRLIESARSYDAALERRLDSFKAASGAGVEPAEVDDVAENLNSMRRELRSGLGRVAGALDELADRELRVVGYAAAGLVLVILCFPISYREVRWVPLVYVLIAVLLLWADLALREGVSRLFRLDAPAPWPLVTVLLFILMGDAMGDLIKMAFRRRARCASCGRRNAWKSRYCSGCGLRLDASQAEDSQAAGDLRRSVAHEMTRTGGHSPPKKPGIGLGLSGLLMFLAGVMVGGIAGRRGRGARRRGRVKGV